MSSTQFWVAILVPPLMKWLNPYLKKFFKLKEFDAQTRERVTAKQYPLYFSYLYTLWVLSLLSTGIAAMLFIMIYGVELFPTKSFAVIIFVGLINMIGAWFILGAILDIVFWQISTENFRDYVTLKQLKSGWGYNIKQQIKTLLKLGFIYYLITGPITAILLVI